jgi:hypothetical protein
MIKMKFNGRTFTNGRSLAEAMVRDMNQKIERNLRQAAMSSGGQMKKTTKGFEFEGSLENINRLQKRLEK